MDNLAKKLIDDHKNPIVKVDLPDAKLLFRSNKQDDMAFIEKYRKNLELLFRHERVERRCARSKAEWSLASPMAKVTKAAKFLLHNFGYQDKNGIFLYPEEILFLMETNRIEVTNDAAPLSIQEGYDLLIKHNCKVAHYRVYKKLVLLGYRLLRPDEISRRKSKGSKTQSIGIKQGLSHSSSLKRSTSENKIGACKKICTEKAYISEVNLACSTRANLNEKESGSNRFLDILEKLREVAPKSYNSTPQNEQGPNFYVFLPNNKARYDYDFVLFICEGSILEKIHNHTKPAVYAICSDDISFYRLSTVELPFLK